MALRDMTLTTVVWDDEAGTACLTFEERVTDQGPGSENGNWYQENAAQITVTLPIEQAPDAITNTRGRQLELGPAGETLYRRWERVGLSWVDRGVINPDGTPYEG